MRLPCHCFQKMVYVIKKAVILQANFLRAMKIFYNPFFTGNVYLAHNLWDEVTVGDAALLEQLLMRAGLPQTVADADPEKKEDDRIAVYQAALERQGTTIFSQSLRADAEGTAKQLLVWRDMLVMAGWTPEMTKESENEKLRILALCDEALKGYPSSADRWRQVLDLLKNGKKILGEKDSVEVQIPKELIHPLIKQVLDLLYAEFCMKDLSQSLSIEGHTCTILTPHEQYEAWQLLPVLGYDADTMLVCDDEKRLNDTMAAIGGPNWQTDRAGCPHSTRSIFDQKDTPKRLIWLDCAGNRPDTNPYAFLTKADREELKLHGIQLADDETRSALEAEWLNTLLNRIGEWILIAPKYRMGEALGEHPVITSIKQKAADYKTACGKGSGIALPLTDAQPTVRLKETGEIRIDPALITAIIPPTDSYSTIEKLVHKPLDYVLEKLGGLAAPEDDQEVNEHLMMGPIAHKMVELLVNDPVTNRAYPMAEIHNRFRTQYDHWFEKAMEECKKEAAFLGSDENKNVLAVFKDELHDTIDNLLKIIDAKGLEPYRCEYEFTTPFGPFANPHGYVDMLLKEKAGGDWVIFDFKWSIRDIYPKGLERGEAYQFYMYQHAVVAQLGGHVAWYGYYLFPDMKLYTYQKKDPQWNEWLQKRQDRLTKLNAGQIEHLDKEDYPKHLILKNLNLK